MTQLSSLLTDDSRSPIQKLRRSQLQKIARKHEIKFDPSGPATDLRKLIEGSGIDVLRETEFDRLQVKDEDGMVHEILEPKVKPHATASKTIDYDAIIEANSKAAEKSAENDELKKKLESLEAMVAKLTSTESKVEEIDEHPPFAYPGTEPKAVDQVMNEEFYRDRYTKFFGKKPHHKMKLETIKAKVDGYNT
jgi:hypothetical protein